MSDYIINKPDDFELNETLECGQCFHFNKLDEMIMSLQHLDICYI